MELNDLSYIVRGAIFTVFKEMGPGLLESVYEAALILELKNLGIKVKSQVNIPVFYKNERLGLGFKMDILVEDQIIIEVKSVEMLINVHKKQLLNYLKLSDKRLGFLVNFNVDSLRDKESLVRIIN
ncbi:MAG: GxxExxY protein [Cytophagaceae bacterium]|nr:GxxExxY protein [Cytophagaceae bacterium]MBK9933350.1 GxxExxY protein [Cytophagaceae bacterium]MBL0325764.1 GxxExxY protein [Cytophagaceae bacterium]